MTISHSPIVAATALALAALLAGCGGGAGATSTSARPTGAALDAMVLDVVRPNAPAMDDAALLRAAHAICTDLDSNAASAGAQAVELAELKVLTDRGWTGAQVGNLLGAAIAAYCPQYPGLGQ